jgi:hypothetical protein
MEEEEEEEVPLTEERERGGRGVAWSTCEPRVADARERS